MGGSSFRYGIFGLLVESVLELPELHPAIGAAEPHIRVKIGKVEGDEGSVPDGGYVHRVPKVGAYLVRHGAEILIDPEPEAHESHIRLFLLGTAMGIALHQRGVLPLHANGVEIGGRAVLFMGASGAGKSTLASWFVRKGHRLLADDVCAITVSEGQAWAAPGVPRFRLWEEAIVHQGLPIDGLALSYAGDPTYRKYDVPLGSTKLVNERLPVGAIYVLGQAETPSIVCLSGLRAAQELFAHTYRGEYVASLGLPGTHLRSCALVANAVPMFAVEREWGLAKMDQANEALVQHAIDIVTPRPEI